MKKTLLALTVVVLATTLTSCSSGSADLGSAGKTIAAIRTTASTWPTPGPNLPAYSAGYTWGQEWAESGQPIGTITISRRVGRTRAKTPQELCNDLAPVYSINLPTTETSDWVSGCVAGWNSGISG